ncbi:hypothetical protein DL95DRAFT_315935 [Leptodontidium sp. 2 PMI_412]|nr:hypothetical protein DL95DRAFT_315935 [Leptodontidium sp. 2 PMI_412]
MLVVRLQAQRFQKWYWYDDSLSLLVRINCSTEYTNYLEKQDSGWDSRYGAKPVKGVWTYLYPVIDCLSNHMRDIDKAEMASAGVLLGLMPTIIASAGSTLVDTALLASRRPLLAFLLAMGSPSVTPLRTFQYEDVPNMLESRKTVLGVQHSSISQSSTKRAIIVIIEIALALAASVNVFHTTYMLGVGTFISWSAHVTAHPLLWSLFTGWIHLWGSWAFRLDVEKALPPSRRKERLWSRIQYWAQDEFTPCAMQKTRTLLRYQPNSYWFLVVSWWSAVLTLFHYIYGTLVFSSLLFINIRNALIVLIRLLGSTLCCRLIVKYELSGMRHRPA